MPIYLPPISRRRFLSGSLAAASGLVLGRRSAGLEKPAGSDSHRFALLSDIHIAADPAVRMRGVNMFDNLKRVCDEVAALGPLPAAVTIDGDLALARGASEDYTTLIDLLKPLRKAGLPVYLALGNHDDRGHFHNAFPQQKPSS